MDLNTSSMANVPRVSDMRGTLVSRLREAVRTRRVFTASRLADEIKSQYPTVAEDKECLVDIVLAGQRARTVRALQRDMDTSTIGGRWNFYSINDNVSLFYDSTAASSSDGRDAMLMDGIVKAPAYFLILLMNEVPLFSKWLSLIRDSNLLQTRTTLYEAKAWWGAKSPFPTLIYHRDAFVDVQIYDCLDEEKEPCVYIVMKDVPDSDIPFTIDQKSRRMKVEQIVFRIAILHSGAVRITGLGQVNVRLKYMPHFMVNWIASRVCISGMHSWITKAHELNEHGCSMHFESATEKSHEFYKHIRDRLQSAEDRISCRV